MERLAECVDQLPEILVHLATGRVVDGMHRVAAHRRAGRESIRAKLFDGSEPEAAVEAVRRNTRHGLPLTLDERRQAARQILADSPDWSDRLVADICALSPKTVAAIRVRTEEIPQSPTRLGRDGRRRAFAAGRRVDGQRDQVIDGPNIDLTDAALTSADEGGEPLVQWMHRTAPDDWAHRVGTVPLGRVYAVAAEARRRAAIWEALALALEERVAMRRRRSS